jgi:hypothetical protein
MKDACNRNFGLPNPGNRERAELVLNRMNLGCLSITTLCRTGQCLNAHLENSSAFACSASKVKHPNVPKDDTSASDTCKTSNHLYWSLIDMGRHRMSNPVVLTGCYASETFQKNKNEAATGPGASQSKVAGKMQDRDLLVRVVGVNGPPHDVQMVEVGPRRVGHNNGETFPGRLENRVRLVQPKRKAANECSLAGKFWHAKKLSN